MLKKIIGKVECVELYHSTMDNPIKVQKQGLATAVASAAMDQASPGSIALAGHQGFRGYLIKFKLNGIAFEAKFTDIQFKENDVIIVIYNDEIKEGVNTFAALNPSNGILSMSFLLGQGSKAFKKSTIKFMMIFNVIVYFVALIMFFFLVFDELEFENGLLLLSILTIASFGLGSIMTIWTLIADKKYAEISDEIFKLIGFKDYKNMDIMGKQVNNRRDVNVFQSFDYRYREAVDYDPYPPECIPELLKEIEDGTKKDEESLK